MISHLIYNMYHELGHKKTVVIELRTFYLPFRC